MQEQAEKNDARPPSQRRKVILFGCAALFLSFICLAGVAAIVGLYSSVRSETSLADGETITEPDQRAVAADAHTATPQEDVAGETAQEVVRGDQAWTMAQEANQFNDPPPEGMEYVSVRLHVRSIGTVDEADDVDAFSFNTLGDQNVQYDVPSVVEPEPVLNASLYPGGEYEGWALYQAARGETNLLLVFDAGFSGAERYLSLEH